MSKIMLVEDDNNLREIYEARLLAEGYQIISAKDGEEALALATKEKPDLIISDVMMPKISGFDMLDILRSTPGIENTKVVMMTALSQAEDKERADKLGANKYLVKSQVTLEDVARVADELLNGTSEASDTEENQASQPAQETADRQAAEEPTPAPANTVEPEQSDQSAQTQAPAADTATNQSPPETPVQPNEPAQNQAPPPAPTAVMPEVNTDSTPVQGDQSAQTQAPAADTATNQSPPSTQPAQDDDATQQADNTSSQAQQPTPAPQSTTQPTNPVASPSTDNAQTTAEEEQAVDAKIDDFVKNQLQSNEPPQPEPEKKAEPQQQPEAELDQGSGVTLANAASTTPTLNVKQAPEDNTTNQSTPPPAQPAPVPEPQQQPQPQPAPPKQEDPNNTAPSAAGGQRVIQPLPSSPDNKANINDLANQEDEKNNQQSPLPASSVVSPNGQTTTPPSPNQDPNNTSPGNVIQPGGQNQNTPAPGNDDPNNIAL